MLGSLLLLSIMVAIFDLSVIHSKDPRFNPRLRAFFFNILSSAGIDSRVLTAGC